MDDAKIELIQNKINMESLIGKTIDNYRILEVIGRGGMGVVLKALDTNLEKIVALKMIDPFLAKDENFVRRFKTEAKALAKSENPNIVTVHALRDTEAGFFMVMEYVDSKTLSQHISEKGAFNTDETIAITKQVLNAIGHAHKVGVIHRDIKPKNILLCYDGKIKVMDFGIAKVYEEKGPASTVTQARAGTLYYMSPEQVKGLKNVDARSDIYSIGMTIYEMITGRVPFEKTDSDFTIQKHIVEGEIPSPTVYKYGIPKQLLKFILKAIDKDRDKRFQSITEMEEALVLIEMELDKSKGIVAKRSLDADKKISDKKKHKFIIISLSAITIIAIFFALYFHFNKKEKKVINIAPKEDTIKLTNLKSNIINNDKEKSIQFANLTIKTIPTGAIVLVDGESKGKTELHIDSLESKNYSITIKLKGYEQLYFNTYLYAGNNFISRELKKIMPIALAALDLKMDVEGYIYIDNKQFPVNANQSITENIPAQNHLIKFVNKNNLSREINIDLESLGKKELVCYFQQVVSIQTLDENGISIWASIIVDNEQIDKVTPTEITLSAGVHIINVKKNGYKTLEKYKEINISPEFLKKTIPLVFHLVKL